jgi:hypothetical protein
MLARWLAQQSADTHGPAAAPLPKIVALGDEAQDLSPIRDTYRAREPADVAFSSRAGVEDQPITRLLNRWCSL